MIPRTFYCLLAACAFYAQASAAEPRTQSRSMVISQGGIVATEQVLASQAAAQILADGGSAADAAVAANAMMGVVSPGMCGIGGDMFCLVYDARSGKTYGLNASGWAPQKLSLEFLKQQGIEKMPESGIHSVTVPGAVAGWEALIKRFGRKKLKELLRPAIRYAEDGFPVTELVAEYWHSSETKLKKDKVAADVFLPNGSAPKVGEIFRNPELAWSYRQIAARGAKGFYQGELARRMVAASQKLGGTMDLEDLKEFSAEWVEPISTTYRGWTVYEIPPQGQGIAALMMLNLMELFPLSGYGHNSPKALHLMIEAKKLAYEDMLHYVADPSFARIPVREMLSKKNAAARAKLINQTQANPTPRPTFEFEAGPETTYLCVVDKEGNMVSYIQSNYHSFGSGIVPGGCGFALQNRGGLFSLDPKHPNVIEPRKRPLHTIIPAIMAKEEVRIAFGIMGGWNQAQAHAQFVSKIVDFGMNIQQALDTPRFTKMTFPGNDVRLESRIPSDVREELQALGHELQIIDPYATDVGGGQAVLRDFANKVNYGASDPRKDGAAIPEPATR